MAEPDFPHHPDQLGRRRFLTAAAATAAAFGGVAAPAVEPLEIVRVRQLGPQSSGEVQSQASVCRS
jgi:hypothetical protein